MIPTSVIDWIVARISSEFKAADPLELSRILRVLKYDPDHIVAIILAQKLIALGFASVPIEQEVGRKYTKWHDQMLIANARKDCQPIIEKLKQEWSKELDKL